MVHNQSHSDGTDDDDLPPLLGKPADAAASSQQLIDQQIRHLELDAYHALLRAFSAQSEAITWSKEALMSDMRKELRVADEQHREMLRKVSHDDTVRRIRHARATTTPGGKKRQKVILPPPPPVPVAKSLPSASGGRRSHCILYPEVAALEKSLGEMEQWNDLGKLESARQLAKEYEVALQRALGTLSEYERVDVVDSSAGLDKKVRV